MICDTPIGFQGRQAELSDLEQLLELEKQWPEAARASAQTILLRIQQFKAGFLVAEDETGIIANIIAHPYHYDPEDLSNFESWEKVVTKCYHTPNSQQECNALYIVSGTTKHTRHGHQLFDAGVHNVIKLARAMGKTFVVAGCLLPGYAKFVHKKGVISAADYVFKRSQQRFVDPLLDKYRRLGFNVINESHIVANYFPDAPSLNYSAIVVKKLV